MHEKQTAQIRHCLKKMKKENSQASCTISCSPSVKPRHKKKNHLHCSKVNKALPRAAEIQTLLYVYGDNAGYLSDKKLHCVRLPCWCSKK